MPKAFRGSLLLAMIASVIAAPGASADTASAAVGIATQEPHARATAPRKACVIRRKAKCRRGAITKAKIGKVSLAGGDLRGAAIRGATFTGTDMTGLDLTGATIRDTTFRDVRVGRLDLDGATLSRVTFIGARIGASRTTGSAAGQRASECAAVDDPTLWMTRYAFRCTGGGLSMRGAKLAGSTTFRYSTLPRSDFRDVTVATGHPHLSFEATDVSQSTFVGSTAWLSFASAQNPVRGTGVSYLWSDVSESVLDGTHVVLMEGTDARGSSVVGTKFDGPPEGNLTGVRGLSGTARVLVENAGVAGVTHVQIRENGYFRPGILCLSTPCEKTGVAIKAPAVVTVTGTQDFILDVPGWTCPPAATGVDGVFRATCTTAEFPRAVTGVVRPPAPPPTHTVTVSADDGSVQRTAVAPSTLRIVSRLTPSSTATETNCDGRATCSAPVTQGALVQVVAGDSARVVAGQCTALGDAFMTAPGSTTTCAAVAVSVDTDMRLVVRPGATVNVRVRDTNDINVATPIATFSLWARAPGMLAGDTLTCNGQASCTRVVATGSTVVLVLGDPVLDLSGFCLSTQMFHWRFPGTVNACPSTVIDSLADLLVQSQP